MSTKSIDRPRSRRALYAVAAVVVATSAGAQQRYQAPRTEHGYPDFQGVWTNATITPLQRPEKYGDRRVHTVDEARDLEKNIADSNAAADRPTDRNATIQDIDKNCEL